MPYTITTPENITAEAEKAAWMYDSLDNYPWPFGHHAGPEFKQAFESARTEIAKYNSQPAKTVGAP